MNTDAAASLVYVEASDYLQFAAAGAWAVSCAIALGAFSARKREAYRSFWLPFGGACFCAAGSALCAMADRNADLLPAFAAAGHASRALWGVSLLLLAWVFPSPKRSKSRPLFTGLVLGFAIVMAIVALGPGISSPVPFELIAAAGAAGVLFFPERFVPVPGSAARFAWSNRLVGAVVLIVVLSEFNPGWVGVETAPDSPEARWAALPTLVQSIFQAVAAMTIAVVLWRGYLREYTLPRVRSRTRLAGMPPNLLLPVIHGIVAGLGIAAIGAAGFRSHALEKARLQEEARSSARLLDWPAQDRTFEPGRAAATRIWETPLARLVAAKSSIAAAAAGTITAPQRVLAAASDAKFLPSSVSGPRAWFENQWHRASADEWTLVHIGENARASHALYVLPLFTSASGPQAERLAVVFDLRESLAARTAARMQGFLVVLFISLLACVVVVYTVQILNEAELRSLKHQADAESHAKGEFLAMVSHEVRTPLQSVLGYADLAADEPLSPAAVRYVNAIRSQGAVLMRVVQDILDYSSIQNGELACNADVVSVRGLLEDVRRVFADRAALKALDLQIEIARGTPEAIEIDRTRVFQILLNLVGNAVKFTVRGRVELAARPAPGFAKDVARPVVEFTVSDTGPGIPMAMRHRIFEPFRKLRDDRTTDGGGVGLGLAICQQLVERMRGKISVEGVYGEGSVFRVQLPALGMEKVESSRKATETVTQSPVPARKALAGLRMLIVDDNPYVREMLRESLRRLGAVVWARPDGASTLEVMRSRRFDVVMFDLKLPDMDGSALATALRRLSPDAGRPWIIGMSAGLSDGRLDRAFEAGLDEFLLKPISMAGLVETIAMSPAGALLEKCDAPVGVEAVEADEMRTAFFSEATAVLDRISSVGAEGKGKQLAAEAHYLANGCMVFGLYDAFDLCREIEELAEASALERATQRAVALRVTLAGRSAGLRDSA